MPQLLELAQNRRLAIRDGSLRCSITIAAIPEREWFEHFFEAITPTIRGSIGEAGKCVDARSAAGSLVKRMALAPSGRPDRDESADRQSKIPLAHWLKFGDILLQTFALESNIAPARLSRGVRTVQLEALWSASGAGAMCFHRNLVHRFKAPSTRDREEVRRAHAELQRNAGITRRGVPVFLAPQSPATAYAMVAFYDGLIAEVEGYAVNGEPLGENRARIVESMDALHKVTAARALFSRSLLRIGEGK
jgi:hypothetical protein